MGRHQMLDRYGSLGDDAELPLRQFINGDYTTAQLQENIARPFRMLSTAFWASNPCLFDLHRGFACGGGLFGSYKALSLTRTNESAMMKSNAKEKSPMWTQLPGEKRIALDDEISSTPGALILLTRKTLCFSLLPRSSASA